MMVRPFIKSGLMFSATFLIIAVYALWLSWPVVVGATISEPVPGAMDGGNTTDNVLTLVGGVIVLTAIVLLLMKFGLHKVVVGIMVFAMFWLATAALWFTLAKLSGVMTFGSLGFSVTLVGGMIGWAFTKRDQAMINIISGMGLAWAAASLGASFTPWTTVLIMDALALYDIIAVYGTKHMVTLAKGIAAGGMPVGLMIFDGTKGKKIDLDVPQGERSWQAIGWGDITIPAFFVVSANLVPLARLPNGLTFISAGAIIGAVIGYFLLGWIAERWPRPHAGLPPVVGCMIFFAGLVGIISTVMI